MNKVSIRRTKNKRSKQHWWIICSVCKVRMHVRKSHWPQAIKKAEWHINGKSHQSKVNKENDVP